MWKLMDTYPHYFSPHLLKHCTNNAELFIKKWENTERQKGNKNLPGPPPWKPVARKWSVSPCTSILVKVQKTIFLAPGQKLVDCKCRGTIDVKMYYLCASKNVQIMSPPTVIYIHFKDVNFWILAALNQWST